MTEVTHDSDCAMHNEPAYPNGPCDCSALTPRHEAPAEGAGSFSVDDLAQEIRRVDGNHDLGAGALAEALLPFLRARSSAPEAREGDGEDEWKTCPICLSEHRDLLGFALSGAKVLRTMLDVRKLDAGRSVTDELIANLEAAMSGEVFPTSGKNHPAAPSADKLRIDLWWNADDWETTFDNIEDAYEAATGGYGVARLGRAMEHDAVWAVRIDIDTTGDGEADDREIKLFATENEARQALANQGAEQ